MPRIDFKKREIMTTKKTPIEVIIADTHLHGHNYDINGMTYVAAAELAREYGLKRVLHAGDIFEARRAQPLDNLDYFENILNDVFSPELTLDGEPGNHDKTDYNKTKSYLSQFRHHPHFNLYDEPYLEFCGTHFIAYVPFFDEMGVLPEKISLFIQSDECQKAFQSETPVILLGHFGIAGVRNNDGSLVKNKITPELFADFDMVIMGHYHNPSHLKPNIYYPGASIQHKFGETEEKGIHVLYDDLSFDTKTIEGVHKFLIYNFDLDVVSVEELKKQVKKVRKDHPNDTIRFDLIGEQSRVDGFDSSFLKKEGIRVKKKNKSLVLNEIKETENIQYNIENILENFDKFSILHEYSESEIEFGRKLLSNKNK
jgi:DNA repair protein SbcD/Mre11